MPELSVLISALNEQKTVKNVLRKILQVFDNHKIDGEIVFLDNYSTDKTGKLADEVARRDRRVRVIHRIFGPNKDLGSSLKEGLKKAKGKYMLIMDCDMSHSPEEIPNLLKHKNEADIIVGSRFIKGGRADMSMKRAMISRSYNLLANLLLGINVKDITTGFKLYDRKVIRSLKLESTGFGLHPEIMIKALNKKFTAKEIPIYYRRSNKKSTLNYKKQFKSYVIPLLKGAKEKYFS